MVKEASARADASFYLLPSISPGAVFFVLNVLKLPKIIRAYLCKPVKRCNICKIKALTRHEWLNFVNGALNSQREKYKTR
jgi:hypothetical protein